MIVLNKPNKARGPLQNLRPIMLLTTIRKALSTVVLNRISQQVETFLPHSQAGFRRGGSTSDSVFTMKLMSSTAQNKQWTFHAMCIDMSRAFDTIDRGKLLTVMESFVDEDSKRLIRVLLANTTAKVRVERAHSDSFTLFKGTPQGDSLSPVLFTSYLEACLRVARQRFPPRPAADRDMVGETQYADDCNFYSTSLSWLQSILPILVHTFSEWDLKINDSKTEWLHFDNSSGQSWRQSRQLGSLLGDEEDLARRKALASEAYRSMYTLFLRRNHVSLEKRIRVYNAFVLPVLLYNSGTWALTQTRAKSLSAFHRRQLRSLLGIRWPQIIRNRELYRRTRQPDIANLVDQARVRLLGHCLRMDPQSPPQQALALYSHPTIKGRVGRPKTSLGTCLRHDVNLSASNLQTLRDEAADRHGWRRRVNVMTNL